MPRLAARFVVPVVLLSGLVATAAPAPVVHATGSVVDITVPGGAANRLEIRSLDNGNFVVIDEEFDGVANNVGAVHLFDGDTLTLISTITGSSADDQIGFGGVITLDNGNFVIMSPYWDDPAGPVINVGAATFVNGTTGLSGVVSTSNSLYGQTAHDQVGYERLELENGHYVVVSQYWDNPTGPVVDVGAVTWGDKDTGVTGPVSTSNSLVGQFDNDQIGNQRVEDLPNGNYVVLSPSWNSFRGAATWQAGTGSSGVVGAANSIVGANPGNGVGDSIAVLTNGNYVVTSDNGSLGSATWASGTVSTSFVVGPSNSLVGSQSGDLVGVNGGSVVPLTNGNYVVTSPGWDNGGIVDAGAATWGDGDGGTVGAVTTANSLTGSSTFDRIGRNLRALANGNYVTFSTDRNDGATLDVGAVTWGNGTTGTTGTVSSSNSLIGASTDDGENLEVEALTNGNYVVGFSKWDDPSGPVADVGAVRLLDGTGPTGDTMSATGSLIGSTTEDRVGSRIFPLTNGNYVVASPFWDNGPNNLAGAATWGSGTTGVTGVVSAANSLVGSSTGDQVGDVVYALETGHYIVASYNWSEPTTPKLAVGALTWGNGTTGITGAVSPSNSLVGDTASDAIGSNVAYLSEGPFIELSQDYDNVNGPLNNAGAVIVGSGLGPTTGTVATSATAVTVIGGDAGVGASLDWAFDSVHGQLLVARGSENLITVVKLAPPAPTGVSATASDSSASVSWTAPAFAGIGDVTAAGSLPLTSYTATASPGGASCTTTGTSCTVPGLTNGVAYSFTVRAANEIGLGTTSAPSNTVVPHVPLPATFHGSESLRSGRSMSTNRYLLSKDARTLLGLRADGNLILVVNDRLVFQSNTAGQGVTQMLMNRNGALQLLNGSGGVVWSSNTSKRGARLEVLDGRAVVRSGSKIQFSMGTAIASLKAKGSDRLGSGGTLKFANYLRSKNKQCALAVLGGEIVTWGPGGVVNYRSNTAGSGATQLKLQSSGNLQLLRANKTVAWQTNTTGRSPKLTITNTCVTQLTARSGVLFQAP